jgi:hypothetical protein
MKVYLVHSIMNVPVWSNLFYEYDDLELVNHVIFKIGHKFHHTNMFN